MFFNERQKGGRLGWDRKWGETGRRRGRVSHNQDILCGEKNLLLIIEHRKPMEGSWKDLLVRKRVINTKPYFP